MMFIARKRSLGQGNIFTGVCQTFCPEEGRGEKGVWWKRGLVDTPPLPPDPDADPPPDPEADTPLPVETATGAGGTHPTGMHSCVL